MARAARPALFLGLVALAAVWALAAWALWQTDVPGGLRLPEVEASAVLDSDRLDEARDFELFLRISFLVSLVVVIAVFVGYAGWRSSGWSRRRSRSSTTGGRAGTTCPSWATSTG